MEVYRRSSWLLLLLGVMFLATTLQGVQGEVESEGPSESECRPYIEKALKEQHATDEAADQESPGEHESVEDLSTVEITADDSDHIETDGDDDSKNEATESTEKNEVSAEDHQQSIEETQSDEIHDSGDKKESSTEQVVNDEAHSIETTEDTKSVEADNESLENTEHAQSVEEDQKSTEDEIRESTNESIEDNEAKSGEDKESDDKAESVEQQTEEAKSAEEEITTSTEEEAQGAKEKAESVEDEIKSDEDQTKSTEEEIKNSNEETKSVEDETKSAEDAKSVEEHTETSEDEVLGNEDVNSIEEETKSAEEDAKSAEEKSADDAKSAENAKSEDEAVSAEETKSTEDTIDNTEEAKNETKEKNTSSETDNVQAEQKEKEVNVKESGEQVENIDKKEIDEEKDTVKVGEEKETDTKENETEDKEESEPVPEEELTNIIDMPTELRPREHVEQLLKLDDESSETEKVINRVAEITLRDLKRLYENAIKPLEILYKYRDLSNRHFGDSEIFSKPLILFMGPWSGGKSSIINYLLNNEYNETSLRTGAEPSPAYFNILMHGDEPEILDGTQLAADFTFSGLQKFGQGLEERLRGLKLPTKLLEKINIVEIPGILEVRKQVSRVFPFNDACQWFIDRADIIFLVYDPSKLDVGPETEAILDQLKGREHQTRIILNKADQVKPEELMRVQGALIWNISPLMSSAQPPAMYTTSLWSRPYEPWAPMRLLQAQERAFLRDLRSAIEKRIENKIASARRFAVRVRNHAKMVDCYLTTYYNHKSVFGNKKLVSDAIIEHPQDYHIYEGLSTLTNISRYDLPDPDVYRDFFKLNPLYDFQQLSATCTYFRGCPINRLDVAIAYDLPELVGKHKRLIENALAEANLAPGS